MPQRKGRSWWGCSGLRENRGYAGTQGLKILEKSCKWISQLALSPPLPASLCRLHTWCVGAPEGWGEGQGAGGPPCGACMEHRAGAGGGVALASWGGREERKMRSLQSSAVGCDSGARGNKEPL